MGNPQIDGIGRYIEYCSKRMAELAELSISVLADYALSGRCEVALCCIDDRRERVFGPTAAKLGIIPGECGSQRLPRALVSLLRRRGEGRDFCLFLYGLAYAGPMDITL